jgi:multidrug efflux pump subunit AcrA (membrane-fusion protein)
MASESLEGATQKSEQGPKDIRWLLTAVSVATVVSFGVLIYSQLQYQHQVQAARNQAAEDATQARKYTLLATSEKQLAESYKKQAEESKASAARDKLQAERIRSQARTSEAKASVALTSEALTSLAKTSETKTNVASMESMKAWQLAYDKASHENGGLTDEWVKSYLSQFPSHAGVAAPVKVADAEFKKAKLSSQTGSTDVESNEVWDLELQLAELCSVVVPDFTDSKVRAALESKEIADAKQALKICAPYLRTASPFNKTILPFQDNLELAMPAAAPANRK